MENRSG